MLHRFPIAYAENSYCEITKSSKTLTLAFWKNEHILKTIEVEIDKVDVDKCVDIFGDSGVEFIGFSAIYNNAEKLVAYIKKSFSSDIESETHIEASDLSDDHLIGRFALEHSDNGFIEVYSSKDTIHEIIAIVTQNKNQLKAKKYNPNKITEEDLLNLVSESKLDFLSLSLILDGMEKIIKKINAYEFKIPTEKNIATIAKKGSSTLIKDEQKSLLVEFIKSKTSQDKFQEKPKIKDDIKVSKSVEDVLNILGDNELSLSENGEDNTTIITDDVKNDKIDSVPSSESFSDVLSALSYDDQTSNDSIEEDVINFEPIVPQREEKIPLVTEKVETMDFLSDEEIDDLFSPVDLEDDLVETSEDEIEQVLLEQKDPIEDEIEYYASRLLSDDTITEDKPKKEVKKKDEKDSEISKSMEEVLDLLKELDE